MSRRRHFGTRPLVGTAVPRVPGVPARLDRPTIPNGTCTRSLTSWFWPRRGAGSAPRRRAIHAAPRPPGVREMEPCAASGAPEAPPVVRTLKLRLSVAPKGPLPGTGMGLERSPSEAREILKETQRDGERRRARPWCRGDVHSVHSVHPRPRAGAWGRGGMDRMDGMDVPAPGHGDQAGGLNGYEELRGAAPAAAA